MFALRGTAVSLTFFVLLYCLFSALVVGAWRSLKILRVTEQSMAALLFALRVTPLVASVAITFAFVVPSFDLLEPRSIDEGIGAMPPTLGICALLLIVFGCYRVFTARKKTNRVVAGWLEGARPFEQDSPSVTFEAFQANRDAPPLTLVGVRRPRVLVSESTVRILSRAELRIALKHELAHMRSYDNLKKLIFRFCPFPGMAKLESAWSHSAELAADDAAVSKADEAVDLAAALVKLSRLVPVESAPVCTVGFVAGSITARVARLLAWDESIQAQPARLSTVYAVLPLLGIVLCMCVDYGPLLALTHEATEWLVR